MSEFTREHKRGRWVGSPSVILHSVKVSSKALREWSGGLEPTIRVNADLDAQRVETDDAEVLNAILARQLGRLRELGIAVVGEVGEVKIVLDHSGDEAVGIRVSGPDRAAVQGLWASLRAIYGEDQHAPWWYRQYIPILFVMFVIPLSGLFIAARVKEGHAIALPVYVGVYGITALAALIASLVPGFELLQPGAKSRLQRFRGRLVAAVVALALGLVASLITPLLH